MNKSFIVKGTYLDVIETFWIFPGSKPVSHHNDYRPDPTGGRGGSGADRIRSEHNGRNGNGLQVSL